MPTPEVAYTPSELTPAGLLPLGLGNAPIPATLVTVPVLPPTIALSAIDETDITMDDVTTCTLNGDGSFDKLMRAARIHLQEEFTKGRIQATEYAQTYLAVMQVVMGQALTFSLTSTKAALEANILKVQYQNVVLSQSKLVAEIQGLNADITLKNQQMLVAYKQARALDPEYLNILKQGDLLEQQRRQAVEQTDNLKNDNGFKA